MSEVCHTIILVEYGGRGPSTITGLDWTESDFHVP